MQDEDRGRIEGAGAGRGFGGEGGSCWTTVQHGLTVGTRGMGGLGEFGGCGS